MLTSSKLEPPLLKHSLGLKKGKGLFEKWSTLDPKKFYAIPFRKLFFLVSLHPEFLWKKNKNIKKTWFLVNFPCLCFGIHANLMSDGKKKRLFNFVYNSINIVDKMSISLFRWTVQLILTPKFFVTKTKKLCSIILVSKIIEFYHYTENKKSNI